MHRSDRGSRGREPSGIGEERDVPIQSVHNYAISSVRDYEVTEVVARGKTAQVVRARLDGRTLLLRRPAHEYPSPSDLAQLKYGADLASSLDLSCVLKVLGTRRDGKALVVIHEDPGGRTLRSLLDDGPRSVEQALGIAVQLSRPSGSCTGGG
ncbi:hypothetical protein [Sorangium sp. So ce1153]|uniref:hypothetical protein n=1 Tax=Sorangium sp. So ce1153 TaxID=3133333 RepID=UPI003F5E32B2